MRHVLHVTAAVAALLLSALPSWAQGGPGPLQPRLIQSGGAAHVDNAAFTGGTDDVAPMGALYDTTPPTITDGNVGVPRMNSSRQLLIECAAGCSAGSFDGILKDGTGDTTQANVSGGRLHVDGSGVTQPISGTVTVTQGTGTNLHIVCDSGCSSSAGFADNSAFTFGTTAVNPIAGVLDDTGTNTATENSAAVARITAQKGLHVNLRNNSGTEIGTASTPIRTDPTGSTTQPISAASLPLPTGAATAANQDGIIRDGTGDTVQANVSSGRLHVDGSGVTQPVSGTVTVTDGAGALNVIVDSGTLAATQSGTWNITNISGTVSLPTGAATAANQDGIIRDGTGDTTQANVSSGRLHVDGSGVTQPVSGTVTVTDGAGALNVIVDSGTVSATQSGTWTVQPGNTANTTPWLMRPSDGTNNVNIKAASTAAAASDPSLVVAISPNSPIPTGSNVIGALTANQSVNVAQINGVAPSMGNGVSGTGVQRVTLASDSTGQVAIASLPNEGQQTMANSISVAVASDQSSVPVTEQSSSAILAGQQAVTASAVALPSNTTKEVCLKALVGNALNVYVGPSGVTTSTGIELAPGDGFCTRVTNTNALFVVASSTGSSVSYAARN